MGRFFEDWDEVKKFLDETPTTKEREAIFQEALKSMASIRESLHVIQQELYIWPKIVKFFKSDNIFKYAIVAVACLVGLLASIGLVDLTTTSGLNWPFHTSYYVISGITALATYCCMIRGCKNDNDVRETCFIALFPTAFIGTIWPVIFCGYFGYYMMYNFSKFVRSI